MRTCRNGHRMTIDNTTNRGQCRLCVNAGSAAWRRSGKAWALAPPAVCANRHDLTDPAAVYRYPDGRWECRICRKERNHSYRMRRSNRTASPSPGNGRATT